MEQDPEITLELAMQQAQRDIVQIREDLSALTHFIKGNGDPTRGLLWLVADLGRLMASQTEMLGAQRQALADHKEKDHAPKPSPWHQLGFDVLKQGAVSLVLVLGFLATLGFLDYIRSGRAP